MIIDTASNFHPYECDGPGRCEHCDREESDTHDPITCALCLSDNACGTRRGSVG